MEASERVLVPITYGFSVRYLVPTGALDRIAEVCTPVVGLGWDDPTLTAELERQGLEVVRLPDAHLDHDYRMFRRKIGIVHQRRLASPTSRIQRTVRAASGTPRSRAITGLKRYRDLAVLSVPGRVAALEAAEPAMVTGHTNVDEFDRFLRDHRIDAAISVTPYHDQDGLLMWAARARGLPTLTSVISFDNPTTRDRMLVRTDRVLVWNRYNAAELLRSYPDLDESRVEVIGAPQFDLHRRPDLVVDEAAWRHQLGLPADRPVILYGAGPGILVPHEQRLVLLIDRMIDEGRIPHRPFLVVRRHPNEPAAPWDALQPQLRHGRVTDPWAAGSDPMRSWPTRADLELQMSSLAHSAVHVNVCSSMTVDGAVFDRPQIGPMFVPGLEPAELRRIADFSIQEHWLPIARSGGLATAGDETELAAAVTEALEHPEARREGRRRLVEEILTFDDGRSSNRLADAVAALGR